MYQAKPALAAVHHLARRGAKAHGRARAYACWGAIQVSTGCARITAGRTYVLVCVRRCCCGGRRHGMVIWRCIGVRAGRHAILKISRVRLRDDVERPSGVLALVFVRGLDGVVGAGRGIGEWRMLKCSEGRVERAAEGLREGTSVFGGGNCANGGHG